jgi:hypothetical protein
MSKWKVVPANSGVPGSPKNVSVDYETEERAEKVAAQVIGSKVVPVKGK